ncbi:hypothetical protein Tco_1155339 [Tanacetum coccineum]
MEKRVARCGCGGSGAAGGDDDYRDGDLRVVGGVVANWRRDGYGESEDPGHEEPSLDFAENFSATAWGGEVMEKRVARCGCGGSGAAGGIMMMVVAWQRRGGDSGVAVVASGGEWVWGSGRSGHEEPFWSSPEKSAGKLFRRRRGGGRSAAAGGRRWRWWPDNGRRERVERESTFFTLDSPQDEPIIVSNESEEEETEKHEDTHDTSHDVPEDNHPSPKSAQIQDLMA